VLMYIEAAGLPPGGHGIHLHSVGACTPDFSAAKGHINPEGVKHGLRNPEGPDNGDLPNLYVAADGSAKAEFFTTRVSLVEGDAPALLDEDGSAVIIHGQPDDHMTQPIGGAGGRIGCGIIKRM
ncbi:MAG: superoxide dismutase family protein, partial [Gammaproteobacteria bacterium]|nr:superoxide dismutase family protein [Gammaproteobacteria bacterium]